jgi:septum formation topological specificity factor MinE
MMIFDFMLQKAKDGSGVKNIIQNFLKDLEDNFKASVYETKENLSYYQEMKRECLEVLSRYIDE